ncbi:Porin domain-containing protein, partial [Cynara cardunculus var. scolymus]
MPMSQFQALTSTATKKGGLSTGDVGAVYKYKNTLVDVKLDTESNLEVQYFHHHASLTSVVALSQTPTIDLSATIGTPTFVIGAEAGYETSS